MIHESTTLDKLVRRTYGTLLGSGSSVIPEGPMKGLHLAHSEHVSHAHLRGVYEIEMLEALDRVLKPGMVCYDVGASIGYISILMARKARKVYAFEPAPHAIAEIRRQAAANNFSNIEVVPLPVSDCVKTVSFQLSDTAYGSRINSVLEERWKTISFDTTTLDIFASTHEAPDLIKMDIEGEEGRALEGTRKVLSEKQPVLICEVHSAEQADHTGRVLAACGYKIFHLDGVTPFEPQASQNIVAGMVQVLAVPDRKVPGGQRN